MKPVRVAVVAALLVVAAGVLGTPWMQVVQEHTRMEEVVYTLTETHISLGYVTEVEETGSAIVMQTKVNFPYIPYEMRWWGTAIPYQMNLTKGQIVKVELQARPNVPFTVELCHHTPGYGLYVQGHYVPFACEYSACL